MEYTEPLTLISYTETTDAIGNIIKNETSIQTFAKRKSVGSREFYNANAVGITPTAELQIRACEYNEQKEVVFENRHYSVIRTIPNGKWDIVLVVGIKEGVN